MDVMKTALVESRRKAMASSSRLTAGAKDLRRRHGIWWEVGHASTSRV
jgi:hypothetical protein